ncbi:hypothetical protein ASPCAL12635 [Aspergillus calidoustus]|uniref:Uncharacterized protein n=1 Tax=Aspergillus calidoustus TaxID=454130 RepID=A0A0U5CG91_ASPCI|nr:hypothetical protein ASPCAL12635 [Aspergillus calidoustus]
MARIDLHTVDTLQLYGPRASTVDRKTVKGKILGGEIFADFSRTERAAIWTNLRSQEACDGIIPSLHTFFRDLSYLELCANAVKRLVVLSKPRPTVRSALVHSFRSPRADRDCLIQTSDTTFRRQPGSSDEHLTSGYRQIWMYAMRNYPEMAKDIQGGPRANPTRAKARAKADESVIHAMAALAKKLGFHTPQIKTILRQSPDRQIARAALLQARKPDHYHYDSGTFESLIEQIAGFFALAIPNEAAPVAHIPGWATKLKDRCGAPQEQAQQLDRPHIFFDTLHSATVLQRNLSSLEVRRSVYYAFFGKSSSTTSHSAPQGQSPSNNPLSPLFVPSDVSRSPIESAYDHMSTSGFDEGSFNGRRGRSEPPEEPHQRREDRRHQRQERQQAVEHSSPVPQESSIQSSGGGASTISEVMDMYWDSSDADDPPRPENVERQPVASGGMDSDIEEGECTGIDEDDLLRGAEDGSPVVEGAAAVDHSTLGAPRDTDMSSIPEEGAGAVDVDVDMDLSAQSIAQGDMNDSEHMEQEIRRPLNEPECPEHISDGLRAEAQEGLAGEQMADGSELIMEAGEELLQEDRAARERADALTQLQTPGSMADHAPRPVTELPADLPSLITRLREEGSQLGDDSIIPDKNQPQELPELERATVDHLDRHREDLPDPEQAQRQAIERQEGEDLLFDVPVLEEPTDAAVEEDREGLTLEVPALHPRSMHEGLSSDVPLERRVTVTFYVYERQAWKKMDMVSVSPTQLAEAQIIANRYALDPSQYARFYDGRLRKVAVDECVRAAIDDGSFTVLMSFGKDLKVTRHLVASVAQIFKSAGSEWHDPYHPEKRLRANTGAPSAGPVQPRKDPAPTETPVAISRKPEQRDGRKFTPRTVSQPPQVVRPNRAEADSQPVTIVFCAREKNGHWKMVHEVLVERSDPSQVERVARKEARNRQATFYDKNLRKVTPAQCFEAAIEDDTNKIFMNFGGELAMDEETIESIAREVEL